MFQRTNRDSLEYLVCKGTLEMYDADGKRYGRYVLRGERWTWGSRDGKIISFFGSNKENTSFGAEDN
jgi:hypothetical protein